MNVSLFTSKVGRLLAGLIAITLLATACSTDNGGSSNSTNTATAPQTINVDDLGDNIGPTDDELNTIAIAQRFSQSTAALSVTVAGTQMIPGDDGVLTQAPDGTIAQSSGSGVLVDVDGTRFLVTNFHVVMDTLTPGTSDPLPDSTITATFGEDEIGQVPLRVVGVNPSFDLALLEPESGSFPDAVPFPLANSDTALKGQKTLAMGNPFGLGVTLTTGSVSSTGRFVQSVGGVGVPMIQTDAAINPGNSGGALINSSGELLGINTAIFNPEARAFAGIGFAVPSNLLAEALVNLQLGGVSSINDTRPSFGAQLGTLEFLAAEVRAEAGLPDAGIAVLSVAPGGPAEAAGLRSPEFTMIQGLTVPVDPDIIVGIDGESVVTAMDLNAVITFEADLGQEVVLTVLRDGAETEIPVVLG